MIRLKLVSLLLSGCLATGLGVGRLSSSLKIIKSMDLTKIIESIYNPSSEDSSENVENEYIDENANTSNEEVINKETTVN